MTPKLNFIDGRDANDSAQVHDHIWLSALAAQTFIRHYDLSPWPADTPICSSWGPVAAERAWVRGAGGHGSRFLGSDA